MQIYTVFFVMMFIAVRCNVIEGGLSYIQFCTEVGVMNIKSMYMHTYCTYCFIVLLRVVFLFFLHVLCYYTLHVGNTH